MVEALLENIILGWKWLTVANTLTYYDTAIITTGKSFIVQAQLFRITISKIGNLSIFTISILKMLKVVLIRLGIYVFVNKARVGGSPQIFTNTLWRHNYMRVKFVYLWCHNYIIINTNYKQQR